MSDYIVAANHIDEEAGQLILDSEGYIVVGDENWQDVTFITTLVYNGGNIGIAPRVYDLNMYMFMTIRNETVGDTGTEQKGFASLDVQVTYDTYNLAQRQIEPLVVGQTYNFETVITGTNYRISMNDTVLFNIEYSGMSKGQVGIYGTAGTACEGIDVQSLFADAWGNNVHEVVGGIVDIQEMENEDKYLFLSNPTFDDLYAGQEVDVIGGEVHSLSFNANGAGTVRLAEIDGANPQIYEFPIESREDWSRIKLQQEFSGDCTRAILHFYVVNSALRINDVQLEDKIFATDYIYNESTTESKVRDSSIITYPAKDNIQVTQGSVSMWVNPAYTYNGSSFKPAFFEYGSSNGVIRLSWEADAFVFKYGTKSVSLAGTFEEGNWYHLVGRWSTDGILITVNGVTKILKGQYDLKDSSDIIRIGHSYRTASNTFYGAIDETIVYSSILTDEEIKTLYETADPVLDSNSMIMRATFNHAIANFNKSIIEATLAPNYGSPVLIEKEDGQPMRKVSFFDFYTGEYKTFNEELVIYDKTYDYVEISYHDNDVDQQSFKISVQDAEGVSYGVSMELRGRKLYLNLTDEEKELLDNVQLFVTYQLEDSYTVDFNIGVPDSFRVTLGKHDGQAVKVIYEGNRFTDEKLATMVELNPLLSPNHEGFLYITRNDEPVTSFRIRATPDDLPANGGSESLVVVEPLDTNGNYISHCRLDVSCELGTIVPTYDEESIKLRDRAGRFLYRYRSPILTLDDTGSLEVVDTVSVIDRDTGIGVQVPITLTTLQEHTHTIGEMDSLEKIAEHYGATVEDIALANELSVPDMRLYIIQHRGTDIQIPVNYSAKQLEKAPLEIKQDTMIAYLTNMITDYMNKPASTLPNGLGTLLDFNGDGMIDIREMTWLRDNRLTVALENKYNAVVAWDETN